MSKTTNRDDYDKCLSVLFIILHIYLYYKKTFTKDFTTTLSEDSVKTIRIAK